MKTKIFPEFNALSFSAASTQLLGELRYSQGLFDQRQGLSGDLLATMAAKSVSAYSQAMTRGRSGKPTFDYSHGLSFLESLEKGHVINPADLQQLHLRLNNKGGNWRCVKLKIPRRDRPEQTLVIDQNEHSISTGIEKVLCQWQRSSANNVEPLITIPILGLQIMALFPFLDGNMHIVFLLTRHLLVQAGHRVLNYTDIESELAATTDALYQSLYQGTFFEEPSIENWLSYWWSLLLKTYQRFDHDVQKADIKTGRGAKTELVTRFVNEQQSFSSADIARNLPTVSSGMIRKSLRDLRDKGQIKVKGHGRGALWVKT